MTDYDASDRGDVKEAQKRARVEEREDLDVIRDIMRTAAGRRWMYRKLGRCHAFSNPYTANPHDTAFQCGEMNVGQILLAEITAADPESLILMLREANERHIASDAARANRKRQPDPDGNGEARGNFVNYDEARGDDRVERDEPTEH